MTNPAKLYLSALEARAKLTASMFVGPSSMSVSPFDVLRLVEAARERDALSEALEKEQAINECHCGHVETLMRESNEDDKTIRALRAERDALKASLSDDGLERGLAGVMMDVLWPEFGGNHRDAEFWHEAAEIVQFVIKTIRARAALRSQSPKEPTT